MKPLAILAACSVITLAACSSYDQRVAATCSRMGAPPGSDHYWDCVHLQYETDSRDRAQWGAATLAGGLIMMGR